MTEPGPSASMPAHAASRLARRAADAIQLLEAAVSAGRPADSALAAFYKQHRELGSRDRRFISSLAFAWFRWKGWLDLAPHVHPAARGATAWLLDGLAPHPAIEALLADAGQPAPPPPLDPSPSGLTAQSRLCAARLGLHDDPTVLALVPAWLPGSLYVPPEQDPASHVLRAIESLQKRPPAWIRMRPGCEDAARTAFAQSGTALREDPRIPGAAAAPDSFSRALATQDRTRLFEVQDIASQAVGLACAPQPGSAWWDACCGSAGKAIHLADLAGPSASILASDPRESALNEAARRIRDAGISSIRLECRDPLRDGTPHQRFDGVLVDAPCSGIGTWGRNPDARWRTSAQVPRDKAALQLAILRTAADAVKPGGCLVYAVCTLTTAETDGTAAAFLAERPDFQTDPLANPFGNHPQSRVDSLWVWPWQGPGTGMFATRFRRLRL